MTKDDLARQLTEIKGLERKAYILYEGVLPLITEAQDRQTLKTIMDDELRHEQLAQDAIDLLAIPITKPLA